jgi:hypothetical protein
LAGEVYETNKQHGKVVNTAGDILFSKFGLEDKLSVVNAMLPSIKIYQVRYRSKL